MSFVTCPDCGHVVSAAARTCVNCGRELAGQAVALETSEPTSAHGALTPHVAPKAAPARATAPVEETPQHTFFPVATHKFVVMSLCTLGGYSLFWCYRSWQRIAARTREPMSPFWRTFFAPLWGFSLLPRIQGEMARRHVHPWWSPGVLATLYLLISVTWRLPDPWWLISLGSFVPLIPVVRSIELLHASEQTREGANREYSGPNIVGIIIGGTLLILAFAGAFMEAA